MTREVLPTNRRNWRQKVVIHDRDSGRHSFYVEFGEYADGRLGEVFVTAHRMGTFTRGTLDALARSISLSLQSGTSPHQCAKMLVGMDYPPQGVVEADGSAVRTCTSLADYIGQEILSSYGDDGKRLPMVLDDPPAPNEAGYTPEDWRSGV